MTAHPFDTVICTAALTDTIRTRAKYEAQLKQAAGELMLALHTRLVEQLKPVTAGINEALAQLDKLHQSVSQNDFILHTSAPKSRSDRKAWESPHGPRQRRR
ncbi:hypothetical protein [Streptomyces sp. NPDC102487]|uniref:hypothetical protein n=1 Tax=Streptomyces sp. NPDC102487 TaxID=3366182 RepID=UPI00382D934F